MKHVYLVQETLFQEHGSAEREVIIDDVDDGHVEQEKGGKQKQR